MLSVRYLSTYTNVTLFRNIKRTHLLSAHVRTRLLQSGSSENSMSSTISLRRD